MGNINILKDSINYEQLFSEGNGEAILKGEYLIPDTHPDVFRILTVECKPVIRNKETMEDKFLVEGDIQYNVMYLAEEEEGLGAHSVIYNDKFSTYIDIQSLEQTMKCEVDCDIEHIYAAVINERKVSIDGILKINYEAFKTNSIDMVKEIESDDDVEMRKKIETFDNMLVNKYIELKGSEKITIGTEKPEIDMILKCTGNIHKKDTKIIDGKMTCSCFVKFNIIYRGVNTKDLYCLDEDLFVSNEEELGDIIYDGDSSILDDFNLKDILCSVESDDLGEKRVISLESICSAIVKVYNKTTMEILDDAYMINRIIDVNKENVSVARLLGNNKVDSVVKDNLYINEGQPMPSEIISTKGKIEVLSKICEEGKVKVEGLIKAQIIYRSDSEEYMTVLSNEIPFNISVDIMNVTSQSIAIVKCAIEDIQSAIEANTIAIKSAINICVRAWGDSIKKCVIDIMEEDEQVPEKKSSVSIYTVQSEDTLWSLSKKYYTTIDELMRINGIEDENSIDVGQKLIIPGRAIM